jgi:hypothetical protein
MDELPANSSPYSFPKREGQLGLQRPLPLRNIEATAIDVEPLLNSELLSDGLVDCQYPMPLASGERVLARLLLACFLVVDRNVMRRFRGGRKMGSDPSSDRLPSALVNKCFHLNRL